jgi:hypothetical protein
MGTGKTAFTRYFVRSFFDDRTMQVTSPTYLLDLHYAAPTRPGITCYPHPHSIVRHHQVPGAWCCD